MRQGCHFLAFLLRSQPNALLFLAWRQNTFLQFHVYVKLITVLCAMPFLSEVHVYIQGGSKQKRGVGKWKKHSQGHHWLNVFFCVLALFSWSYLRIWKDLFKRLHEKQGHYGSNQGCVPFCFIVLGTTKNSLFYQDSSGLLMKFMPIALYGIPHLSYLMNPLNLIE